MLTYNLYQNYQMPRPTIHIGKLQNKPNDSIVLHSHIFHELIFIVQGNVEYIIEGKRYAAQTGDLIIIPPHLAHQIILSQELEEYERYIVWINDAFWQQLTNLLPDINFTIGFCQEHQQYLVRPHKPSSQGIELIFKRIYEEYTLQHFNWHECAISYTMSLMTHINRTLYNLQYQPKHVAEQNLVDKLLEYVDANLHKNITTTDIAQHLDTNPSTISRICKTKLNISLYQFVMKRRLLYSKNQILADIPFNIIYQNVGFSDYSAFYRAFKKEFGVCPRAFKRSILDREN